MPRTKEVPMSQRSNVSKFGALVVSVGLALATAAPAVADDDEVKIRARVVSELTVVRGTQDRLEIRINGWSSEEERSSLISTLGAEGNHGLAAALDSAEPVGWVAFDARGGGGPGRDPRRVNLKYSRDIVDGDLREIVLVTNHYPGYGLDPLARDAAKLAEFPVSFILLKLKKNDDGEWTGVGRMFVGARLTYNRLENKLMIDEFPVDPIYLKDLTVN
jgi:hypothetical protein